MLHVWLYRTPVVRRQPPDSSWRRGVNTEGLRIVWMRRTRMWWLDTVLGQLWGESLTLESRFRITSSTLRLSGTTNHRDESNSSPVSQICAFTVFPSTLIDRVANSTPIVDLDSRLNSLRVKRDSTMGTSFQHDSLQKAIRKRTVTTNQSNQQS